MEIGSPGTCAGGPPPSLPPEPTAGGAPPVPAADDELLAGPWLVPAPAPVPVPAPAPPGPDPPSDEDELELPPPHEAAVATTRTAPTATTPRERSGIRGNVMTASICGSRAHVTVPMAMHSLRYHWKIPSFPGKTFLPARPLTRAALTRREMPRASSTMRTTRARERGQCVPHVHCQACSAARGRGAALRARWP